MPDEKNSTDTTESDKMKQDIQDGNYATSGDGPDDVKPVQDKDVK